MSAGKRVAAGRLRVDAARAVGKLRDYQLPDPHLWVLEVVRAAVAFGASRVEVSGDADDVRVAWTGPPIDPEALPRLFDELVDPAPRADRRALRLLATGVNTAIGLAPRWVDVVSLDGQGRASRARYTARLLEETDEGGARRLRELEAEEIRVPEHAPASGGLVHLRRLPLWDAIPILVGYGEPRELSIVRRSCDDLPIPVRVGGAELGEGTSHQDLMRLKLGDGLEGFLALIDPAAAVPNAMMDVAEHGVVLARYTWPLEMLDKPRAPVPLRLYVTADRMPTNASRSGVRLDDPPVQPAMRRGLALIETLVERVVKELGDEAEHAWTTIARERLRAAALGLLAASVAGEQWRARLSPHDPILPLPEVLRPLLEVPMLRDALGRPRTPASFRAMGGTEWVHFGMEPFGPELEPWLGDSLWVPPSDPARALLGRWAAPEAQKLAKLARRHARRRASFFDAPERDATLDADPRAVLKVALKAPGKSLRSVAPTEAYAVPGLDGELALLDPDQATAATVVLLVDGREIERVSVEVALPFVAIATCDALTPRYDFRAAQRDTVFDDLLAAIDAASIVASEGLALRFSGLGSKRGDRAELLVDSAHEVDERTRARFARLLRRGVARALNVLGTGERFLESRTPLRDAPVWPLASGEWMSTRALIRLARSGRPIGYLEEAPFGEFPAQPPVLLIDRFDRALVEDLVGNQTRNYRGALRSLRQRRRPAVERLTPPLGAGLSFEEDGVHVAIAFDARRTGTLTIEHWGCQLESQDVPDAPAIRVLVDDPNIVPGEGFRSIQRGKRDAYPVQSWRRRLARAFVDVLIGKKAAVGLHVPQEDPSFSSAAIRGVLTGVASFDPGEWLGKKRLEALLRVPMLRTLGRPDARSVRELLSEHTGAIPYVPPGGAPLPAELGFHPVVLDEVGRAALEKLTGRSLEDARPRLEQLRRQARRLARLRQHLNQAARDPSVSWPSAVNLKGRGFRWAKASLNPASQSQVAVLVQGRPFREVRRAGLPVRVVLDLDESCVDDEFEQLNTRGEKQITFAIAEGCRALLRHSIATHPTGMLESPPTWHLLTQWVEGLEVPLKKRERKILDQLCEMRAFPSVQGGRTSLKEASSGAVLRIGVWDDGWLEPAEGERRSAYDNPVIALPQDARETPMRDLLRVAWPRTVRDVTPALERIQTDRRVARGLAQVPRLEQVADRRFRYSLAELLGSDGRAREALGRGEAALAQDTLTRVQLVRSNGAAINLQLNLIPRIHVIALSPLAKRGRALEPKNRRRVEEAVTQVTARVLRRVVDDTPPDELPEWVRHTLRASCLAGGADFFDRLADTPMFRLVGGGWATPSEVAADAAANGEVWATPVANPSEPFDDRLALRLTPEQLRDLAEWVPAIDASKELELDAQKRINMQRPLVTSLEPTAEEARGAALTVQLELRGGKRAKGTITILKPGFAHLRGFYASMSGRPLGKLPDPARWPTVSRIDSADFEPNRTWSEPEQGAERVRVETQIQTRVWHALADIVPKPRGELFATRVRPSNADGVTVEGVAHLSPDGAPLELFLHDPVGEREVELPEASRLPLTAQLWVADRIDDARLLGMLRAIYRKLLLRVAERLEADTAPDRDAAIVHLLRGERLGAVVDTTKVETVMLEAYVPPRSLADALTSDGPVAVCEPHEVERAKHVTELPLLVDDGGELAGELLRRHGRLAVSWTRAITSQVLGEDEVLHPRVAEPPREPRVESPEPARSPLEAALQQRLPGFSFAGARHVRVNGRRKRPVVQILDAGQTIELAGKHPAVVATRVAVESGSPDADALVRLLLARVAGALTAHGRLGVPGQISALRQLMTLR